MTKWQGSSEGCTITYNSDGDPIRAKGTGYNVDSEFEYTNSSVTSKLLMTGHSTVMVILRNA